MKPLAIDLYCGLGGWAEGLLAEGYDVIGFDIERHDYGSGGYPGQLVLQDVLTLHGSQFRGAALIVASPPCQAYSYRAMPWKRAKALPPPSNDLFDACFRIQREACEIADHHIPMVVENVKGAQPWVGRAKAHYGSYYLWGDVESIGGAIVPSSPQFGELLRVKRSQKFNPDGTKHGQGSWFAIADSKNRGALKNNGDSWFAVAHNAESGHSHNPVTGEGIKQHGSGAAWFDKALDERRRQATAIENGGDWFGPGEECSLQRRASSRSSARKAASAQIAKIPFDLASWIGRCYLLAELKS